MPPPIPVIIAPYDPAWPVLASTYAEALRPLGQVLVAVHHVGSTSVPNLAAKPVIDLIPVVTTLASLDEVREIVEKAGYKWHGELGLAGRRYCTLSDENKVRLAQLHFFAADSPQITRHLAFRNYLRAHPDVAQSYEREKRRARDLFPEDSHAYTEEKSAWIEDVEAKALAWCVQH